MDCICEKLDKESKAADLQRTSCSVRFNCGRLPSTKRGGVVFVRAELHDEVITDSRKKQRRVKQYRAHYASRLYPYHSEWATPAASLKEDE